MNRTISSRAGKGDLLGLAGLATGPAIPQPRLLQAPFSSLQSFSWWLSS